MSIDAKQSRTINQHLTSLRGAKGFEPDSFEAAKRLGNNYLWHEFRLKEGKSLLLTAKGMVAFKGICTILESARLVQYAEPSDAVNEFRSALREWLSENNIPEHASQLIDVITTRLKESRHNYWQVVPVHGLELRELKSLALGSLTLERPTEESLEARGAKLSENLTVEEMLGRGLCLVGAVYGTNAFARREFKFRIDVVTGVLAAVASVCFKHGANPFRLTSETTASGARASSRGVSWRDDRANVSWSRSMTEHQDFEINSEIGEYIQEAGYVTHAISLSSKSDLSPLEQALIRGFFWFSDAQRDTARVMQLVKYWSCAEAIFSGKEEKITKTVSEGVATVLICGIQEEPPERYGEIVSALTKLYDLRSRAVHDARYDHVTYQDVATLSRWTGWMLLGVAGMISEAGYTHVDQIQLESARLAKLLKKA